MTLLHMSINAADPEATAEFLAGIMGGTALPFPPFPDSWIAFSQKDDGTAIEVYPLTHRLEPGPDMVNCTTGDAETGTSFAHIALGSPLPRADILARAAKTGWTTRICNRGPFECVEIWIDNRLLIEVLDPEMQQDYRSGMTRGNWAAMFGFD